jgi:AraC-like DNA-binding protein
MLQVFAPPADAHAWLEAGVVAHLPAGLSHSCFPAVPHAMLTLQLAPQRGPVLFHTLSTQPSSHAHTGPVHTLGWLVRPAAAACLLGASTGVLVNQALPWADLAGQAEAQRLDEALATAGHPGACLAALAASLQRSLQRALRARQRPRDEQALRLCTQVGRLGAQAAVELGLGMRQLERRCQAWLGVSPKQFQRLTRLHRTLSWALGSSGAAMPGAELALHMGYCDQSHLGRELRELAGAPLQTLRAQARADGPWWPLASRRAMQGLAAPVRVSPGAPG